MGMGRFCSTLHITVSQTNRKHERQMVSTPCGDTVPVCKIRAQCSFAIRNTNTNIPPCGASKAFSVQDLAQSQHSHLQCLTLGGLPCLSQLTLAKENGLLLTDGVGCRLCQKDFCDPLRRRDLGVAGVAAVQSPLESIERIIQGLAAVLGNARAGAEFTLFEKCWLFEDLNPKLRAAFERSLEPCFGRLLMEWSK
mmetsp:Transcript_13868/g.31379  ORF Transcript_13868/g.31379 Transcript_13868/m.31379 type:complete len:195 (+) Transcript_13868:187-771(+)